MILLCFSFCKRWLIFYNRVVCDTAECQTIITMQVTWKYSKIQRQVVNWRTITLHPQWAVTRIVFHGTRNIQSCTLSTSTSASVVDTPICCLSVVPCVLALCALQRVNTNERLNVGRPRACNLFVLTYLIAILSRHSAFVPTSIN